MKIGFIGTGVMGTGIINNLLKAGHEVVVYNRTVERAQEVLDNGATWAETPGAVAAMTDATFTMVGYPADVEDVYYGEAGILANARPGQILVDMTTSTPSLAQRLYNDGLMNGIAVLDAPVSGGDIGAKNGTMNIMVGGDQEAYDDLYPVFELLGKAINYFGPAGSGQHAKMANQIILASAMVGLSESLVYAKAAGLDLPTLIENLSAGGAQSFVMDSYSPRILKGDYAPGFFAKHMLKDLRIALDEAKKLNLDLPGTENATKLYTQLVEDQQLGDEGTQALVKLWAQFA